MRVWKGSILLFVSIAVLLLSTLTVSAESDITGDVWHWKYSETGYSWEHTGGKTNIDITSISDAITGSEATLTLTVAGTIEDSDKIIYYLMMTSSGSSYMAYYVNGESYCVGSGGAVELSNPVSGNTFTAIFEIDDPSASYTVYGYTIEYEEAGDESGEMWQDYAPNTYAPWYGLDSGSSGSTGGTPGFEIIAVITALAIALIILRRRK